MPAFVAALIGGLISIIGTLVGKALISIGIGIIAYQGFKVVLDWLKDQMINSITSMDASIVSLVAYMKVGVSINIIFSALAVRMVLNGLQSDTLKKFVLK